MGANSSWRRFCRRRTTAGVISTPRHPLEARSSTAKTSDRQLCSPGQPADHLHPPACLAEGALDEVRVPDALPVLCREAKVGDEVIEVVLHASRPRRGTAAATCVAKALARFLASAIAADPGDASMPSKMRQNPAFTSPWAWTGTRARMLRQRWIRQRWRDESGSTSSQALIRPWLPSEMTSSGGRSHRPRSCPGGTLTRRQSTRRLRARGATARACRQS